MTLVELRPISLLIKKFSIARIVVQGFIHCFLPDV